MGYPDLSVFFGNCTTRLLFAFQFHEGDVGHTVVVGPTGKGMSAFSAGEADDEQ